MQKNEIGRIENLYKKTSQEVYGNHVDYLKLEKLLGVLKDGGSLKYEHLNFISDRELWPSFSEWYQWLAKKHINDKLIKTKDLFTDLKDYQNKGDKNQEIIDRKIFNCLFPIFKNIELISIILRFIDPENFGIFSPPVAYYIDSPRGINYEEEYINYLKKIREYREKFQLEKVAYVDMYIWSSSVATFKEPNDTVAEKLESYHNDIKNMNQYDSIKKFLPPILSEKIPLEEAEFFYDLKLYDLAALKAGIAFEKVIESKCVKYEIEEITSILQFAIDALCKKLKKNASDLHKVRKLRNKASHQTTYRFSKKEVRFMIDTTKEIGKWFSAPDIDD